MTKIHLFKANEIDDSIDFPTHWNELQWAELVVIAESFFQSKHSTAEVLLCLFKNRLAQKYKPKKAEEILLMLSIDDLAIHTHELIAFLKEENNLTIVPVQVNAKNPLENNFANTTVGEFEEADVCLSNFLKENDINELYLFAKNYYKFTEKETPTISVEQQLVAALQFIGCKNQLPAMFPLVFPQDEEDKRKAKHDPMALTKLIHELAGPKNGTRAEIRTTILHEFLYECQLEAEKAPDVY